MFCNEHGTLDYCPECLESNPTQAAIASAERAVIEAAVEHARCRHGIVEDVVNGTFIPNDSVREMETTGRQLDAAVDALLAAREGR